MKKINSLKLTQLSKAELEKKQLDFLKGGGGCICVGCLCQMVCDSDSDSCKDENIAVMNSTDAGTGDTNANSSSKAY